jgi:hypothetical protein
MLEAISFDTSGWIEQPEVELEPGEAGVRVWQNENGDELSLHYSNKAPDLPVPLSRIDQVRHSYRLSLARANGGIVELMVIEVDGIPALKLIAKVAQKPHGMAYLASYAFPRRDFSYTLKIQCPEYGTTGIRDAVVLDQELGLEHVQLGKGGRLTNWGADPYDPTFRGGILRNVADDERYDSQFPDHPLSRLRGYLNRLEPTITVSEAMKQAKAFEGPPVPETKRAGWKFWER